MAGVGDFHRCRATGDYCRIGVLKLDMQIFKIGLVALISCLAAAFGPKTTVSALSSLTDLAPSRLPWLEIEAYSEQYPAWNLGQSPRDMAFFGKSSSGARLPRYMQALGERQIGLVLQRLGHKNAEIEAWPTLNDYGQLTWVLARVRTAATAPWRWVKNFHVALGVPPVLPQFYDLSNPKNFAEVMADYESYHDLYQKPVFGNCIWTDRANIVLLSAWEPMSRLEAMRASPPAKCVALPQPPRLDNKAVTLQIRIRQGAVEWPTEIAWDDDYDKLPTAPAVSLKITNWPADFTRKFKQDIETLSGDTTVDIDGARRNFKFARKSAGQKDNQLTDVADYLTARYKAAGLREVLRQPFKWHGINEQNLIAVIPGRAVDHDKKPIILADHYDTAFAQKVFARTGQRVSVPGADDNGTASATLLRAAEILPSLHLRRDIYLVHVTGEEFPADSLGARHLVMDWLNKKQDIGGIVLMDMIGYSLYKRDGARGPAHRTHLFQVSPGFSDESRQLGALAVAVSHKLEARPRLTAAYRDFHRDKSYLYNTDGIIFAWGGFPVILLNEHLNRYNVDRPDYHEMSDRASLIDWNYATFVAKVAIETAAQMADR